MTIISFDPTQISTNSGAISDNDSDIAVNSAAASNASSDAAGVSGVASDASVAASSAASDVDVIEADNRYANSVYSDPSASSFKVFRLYVTSDSEIAVSHSSNAEV